jgi:TonB-dependent Receptor Plug Domain
MASVLGGVSGAQDLPESNGLPTTPPIRVLREISASGEVQTAAAQQPSGPEGIPKLPPIRVIGEASPGGAAGGYSEKGAIAPGQGAEGPAVPAPPAFSIDNSRSAPVANNPGSAPSASEGRIDQLDLVDQPLLRPGDVFERVPGLIVGQHAGFVKANEYLVRGFYLDNGTDISGWIDDVPYNMPNNPHLHGYLDLNSLIPELVQYIQFQKGPYYAENGDFSSAADLRVTMMDRLPYGIFKTEFGKNSYYRELFADSTCLGQGTLLYAFEGVYYNGPWQFPENDRKFNGILRYTLGDDADGLRVTAWAYSAVGRQEDAISDLAVAAGVLQRFGTNDPFEGLSTQRDQINTQWWHRDDAGDLTKANLYYVYYRFNIFTNTSGDLKDPINGDTVQQFEHRSTFGGNVSQSFTSRLFGDCVRNTFGLQVRNDNIPHIGDYHVVARIPVNVLDDASIKESNLGASWTNEIKWGPKVRTVLGLRADYFHWHVDDFAFGEANSGKTEAKPLDPSGSLILGPWAKTEFFLNGGYGFHTNDARGLFANLSSDFVQGPAGATPNPAGLATPLARTRGAEVGMRTQAIPNLTTTAALWYLRLQSELIFSPDDLSAVPRGASERYGIELGNTYRLNHWLMLDADWAASQAHFLEPDPTDAGTHVDQAIGVMFSGGPTIRLPNGVVCSLHYKYLGPRYLVPDGSISSNPTNFVSLLIGYEDQRLSTGVELLNLFNTHAPDASFANDVAINGVPYLGGITTHPQEPFQARFYFTLRF